MMFVIRSYTWETGDPVLQWLVASFRRCKILCGEKDITHLSSQVPSFRQCPSCHFVELALIYATFHKRKSVAMEMHKLRT